MKLGLPIVSETCLSDPLIGRISIGFKNSHVTTILSVDLATAKPLQGRLFYLLFDSGQAIRSSNHNLFSRIEIMPGFVY